MSGQSLRILYCYLREKWTTLEQQERQGLDGLPERSSRCLSSDQGCVTRRCRLSNDDVCTTPGARDPWFDE